MFTTEGPHLVDERREIRQIPPWALLIAVCETNGRHTCERRGRDELAQRDSCSYC